MRGHEALWVPGTDHAGIATQIAVEKLLAKQGISRHELGREKFLQAVWEWKDKYGYPPVLCSGALLISLQPSYLRAAASSGLFAGLDTRVIHHGRCMFLHTWQLDLTVIFQKLSRAVLEGFLRLHKSGLMFRAQRMVNWVCRMRSVISDIEIDELELTGPTKVKVPGYDQPVEMGVLTELAYASQSIRPTPLFGHLSRWCCADVALRVGTR
jgi:valyl-tRNA synthetase